MDTCKDTYIHIHTHIHIYTYIKYTYIIIHTYIHTYIHQGRPGYAAGGGCEDAAEDQDAARERGRLHGGVLRLHIPRRREENGFVCISWWHVCIYVCMYVWFCILTIVQLFQRIYFYMTNVPIKKSNRYIFFSLLNHRGHQLCQQDL